MHYPNLYVGAPRDFSDKEKVKSLIDSLPVDTTIISGAAPGADSIAEQFASEKGLRFLSFPADWKI